MLKIVAGIHRGRNLAAPRGAATRPTSARVREAIFNLLAHHPEIGGILSGAQVLDLFAGSGAMGLEALSRGAERATFVDSAAASASAIRQNLETLRLGDQATVLQLDTARAIDRLAESEGQFDLVFLDPPYDQADLRDKTLHRLGGSILLTPDAIVVLERAARSEKGDAAPEGIQEVDRRKWGDTEAVFYVAGSQVS